MVVAAVVLVTKVVGAWVVVVEMVVVALVVEAVVMPHSAEGTHWVPLKKYPSLH